MGFFDRLIGASIRHRVVVVMLAVAAIGGGIFIVHDAPLDVLPDFLPARVVIQTEGPGMGILDVEALVTAPLERLLLGTPKATSVRSTSSPGLSVVTLLFEDDVDVYRARQVVAERLQGVTGRLPQGVGEPRLAPIAAPIGAIVKVCATVPVGSDEASLRALRTWAEWVARPRLEPIAGVAQVSVHGGLVERVEVRPDPARLRARHVSLATVAAALARAQAPSAAGFIESGEGRWELSVDARFTLATALAALADLVVATTDGPEPRAVRLGDVAEVVAGAEPPVGAALYDGRPAIYFQVTKLPWADTLRLTELVEAALAELARTLPDGARLEPPIFREADFVRTSIGSVTRALLIGSILVVLVLIAFLRSPRLALVSLVAIPLSLLVALAVLVLAGASVNAMTLGGLAIVVGEVVDDAIVDVENVWRRLRLNAARGAPIEALTVMAHASREIRGAVVYATVIVCVVLVPVLFMGGLAGRIFAPLAEAYMLAIGASLLVALTVTPALAAMLLPRIATATAGPTRFAGWLVGRYRAVLGRVVQHPRIVIGLAALLVAGAVALLPMLGGGFLPEFRERSLIAHANAAPGTALTAATDLARHVSAQAQGDIATHVAVRVGRAELDEDAAPITRMEFDFVLAPSAEGAEWEDEVAGASKAIGRVPGLGFVVEGFLGERIHEVLAGESSPIVVKISGPELQTLRALARRAAVIMAATPGLGAVEIEPQLDAPELVLRPDPEALAVAGLVPADIADAVIRWRQGESVAEILAPLGRVIDVALAGPPAALERAALDGLPIDTPLRGTLPLGSLARVVERPAPALVNHEAGLRRIAIGASAAAGGLSGAARELEAALASELHLPPGYQVVVGGDAAARSSAVLNLMLLGALVLAGIFIMLMLAFGSAANAAIVLINIPLGLVGGVAAALITPEGLSVAGFIGFVTLFGIIARNGIMLVAHLRQLSDEAPELAPEARVLRAAEERLLPILMTAATAFLGLLPLAVSIGTAGSELEAPMALIVCGGLVTATTLNMVVLPTVYVALARRRRSAE